MLLLALVLLAFAGVYLVCGAAFLLWRFIQRRRTPETPAPAPARALPAGSAARYPIVLAHGLLGFDKIRPFGLEYFRGIREALERAGNDVHLVRLPPFAGVEARARALAEAIERIEAPRVNIIAHSMGGLDARYALSRLGIADRVASLITVGTPHRGTPLADWPGYDEMVRRWLFARYGQQLIDSFATGFLGGEGFRHLPRRVVRRLARRLG